MRSFMGTKGAIARAWLFSEDCLLQVRRCKSARGPYESKSSADTGRCRDSARFCSAVAKRSADTAFGRTTRIETPKPKRCFTPHSKTLRDFKGRLSFGRFLLPSRPALQQAGVHGWA
jgi:hypothetical protein